MMFWLTRFIQFPLCWFFLAVPLTLYPRTYIKAREREKKTRCTFSPQVIWTSFHSIWHDWLGAATCQCVGISQPTDTILLEWWYRCHSALAAVSKLRQSSARVFHFLSFKFYNFARNKIGKQYFFLQISHFGWQLLRYDFRLSILARNLLVSFREKFWYSS